MNKVIPFQKATNKLWATIFYIKAKQHVANIYTSHQLAVEDCLWRQKEVQAYKHLLINNKQSIPKYYITTLHRSELPKNWKPLPALGFLFTTNYH